MTRSFLERIIHSLRGNMKTQQDSGKSLSPDAQARYDRLQGVPTQLPKQLDIQTKLTAVEDAPYPDGHIRDRLRQQLGISKDLAARIEVTFPFVRHIRDDGIDTRNKVATCVVNGSQYYLKIADQEQGEIELAMLCALHEIPTLSTNVPELLPSVLHPNGSQLTQMTSYPHILIVGKQYMVYATVAKQTHEPVLLENKLDVLARLHAHAADVEKLVQPYLTKKKLLSMNYGSIDIFLEELHSIGFSFPSTFESQLKKVYCQAADILKQDLKKQQPVVLHKDTKDENWAAGGKILIDWAGACIGPREMDYAKVLYDYAARNVSRQMFIEAVATVYAKEQRYRGRASDLDTDTFNGILERMPYAGVICLTRMIRSNVLKQRKDQTEQTDYYIRRLYELVDALHPSYK